MVRCRRGLRLAAAVVAALAALPAAGQETKTAVAVPVATPARGFTGYGPVAFGATLEQARTLLPAAREIGPEVMLGAATIAGPHVRRLLLEGQTVDGLPRPVDVELRFWKERLWIVHFYTKDNPAEAVRAMLVARLGPPASERPSTLTWSDDRILVTAQLSLHWIAFTDVALSREPQEWVRQFLNRPRPGTPGPAAP